MIGYAIDDDIRKGSQTCGKQRAEDVKNGQEQICIGGIHGAGNGGKCLVKDDWMVQIDTQAIIFIFAFGNDDNRVAGVCGEWLNIRSPVCIMPCV